MKTKTVNGKKYKVTENGTYYYYNTPDSVINVIENEVHRYRRLKFIFGDTKTGIPWNEEHDNSGTIGKTTGNVKMVILLTNYNSMGGGIILTDCILQIRHVNNGGILYQHPKYKKSVVDIVPSDLPDYQYNTMVNGSLYGRHHSLRSAQICRSKLI